MNDRIKKLILHSRPRTWRKYEQSTRIDDPHINFTQNICPTSRTTSHVSQKDFKMSLNYSLSSTSSFFLLAIAILLSGISYLAQTKAQKKAFRRRMSYLIPNANQGRRGSTSKTPPRSLTPEKKVPINASPPTAYKDVFPPSTRGKLPIWMKSWSALYASLRKQPDPGEINRELSPDVVIPFETDYRTCSPETYTPMGMSLAEVKSLGDFPDYAKLSGVPLPEAYKQFKIETATPRPYRPFRWAYHQTMCKFSFPLQLALLTLLQH